MTSERRWVDTLSALSNAQVKDLLSLLLVSILTNVCDMFCLFPELFIFLYSVNLIISSILYLLIPCIGRANSDESTGDSGNLLDFFIF